jgi:deoxyribose-phosphate aldolase
MEAINRYLDAAVLRPEMTRDEAIAAIRESIAWKTKTVCVRPYDIALAKELCEGTETGVSCVLSFPHGTAPTAVKAFEARTYCDLGVDEIDMVANYGMIRSGEWAYVEADIRAVCEACKPARVPVKVILETCQLTPSEIAKATEISITAGAAFVKTSTGFSSSGASVEAVKSMIDAARGRIEVKASGGIRDRETALTYIKMGVTRLGTNYTASKALIEGSDEPGKGARSGY